MAWVFMFVNVSMSFDLEGPVSLQFGPNPEDESFGTVNNRSLV
jgi:hypothetical protein